MSFFRTINPFVVLSVSLFIATGCNAYEFMYSDDSDEPAVLLADARVAMQNGDNQKAIDLLQKALDKAPDDPEIKIELSSAFFRANDIDLLVLKDLAEFISESPAGAGKFSAAPMPACNFTDDISSTTPLDFTQNPAYQLLLENVDVLDAALDLLTNTLETEDAERLKQNIRSNAHLMRAISNMAMAVIELNLQMDAAQITMYRLSNGGVGYCAGDDSSLDQFETFIVCTQLPAIDQAVSDLVRRQSLFSAGESELATAVASARDGIIRSISASCQI